MDFQLTEEEKALKAEFDSFFAAEMKNAPVAYHTSGKDGLYKSDEAEAFSKSMAIKLGEKGWISMAWPKEYGGREASIMTQVLFNESREYHHAPGIDQFGVSMFAPTLLAAASEEQKQRLLPPIAKGEVIYCQGWSEPDAGSDLASLRTLAIRDGDDYVVNGQKTWTTGGHVADRMFLLARTDPDSKRSKGLSFFHLNMDLPGITIRPLHYMNGMHKYNEIFFDNVRILAADRIGEEGDGWGLTRQTMNFERSSVGCIAAVKRGLHQLVKYVKTTKRNGRYLSEDPIVRQKLARIHIAAEVGTTLSYRISWMQQKGMSEFTALASEAKLFGTELHYTLGNIGTEIMGHFGQLEEPIPPTYGAMPYTYQASKGPIIAAGSSEIQRNLIAWTGLGLPRLKFV